MALMFLTFSYLFIYNAICTNSARVSPLLIPPYTYENNQTDSPLYGEINLKVIKDDMCIVVGFLQYNICVEILSH